MYDDVPKGGQSVLIYRIKAYGSFCTCVKYMSSRLIALLAILFTVGSIGAYLVFANLSASETRIVCPKDGSPYVWTPIGSRSENFNWRCLHCGYGWTKSYPEDIYQKWRNTFLEPAFVRDYTLLYLRTVSGYDVPDPLTLNWTGGRQTPEGTLGREDYVYAADGIVVSVSYSVVLPKNVSYEIKVEKEGSLLWAGTLHRRQFLKGDASSSNELRTVYDYYGGVGVFEKDIHVVATNGDPLLLRDKYKIVNDYWRMLRNNQTVKASTKDYISIIISRGDQPTGGYLLQVKSFSWLESYPVKLRFTVNFTDPGEGVPVTEALTNPLVLIPLGQLSPGKYVVEVHIDQYILTFDEEGKPVYTQLQTFKEEVWTLNFVIE